MLPARTIKKFTQEILGPEYLLTVTAIGPTRMRTLNRTYRNVDSPTDILSFPLSKTVGEIYICKSELATHARQHRMPVHKYLPYLIIHGMIHLRGFDHGARMDATEARHAQALQVALPPTHTHYGRARRRRD